MENYVEDYRLFSKTNCLPCLPTLSIFNQNRIFSIFGPKLSIRYMYYRDIYSTKVYVVYTHIVIIFKEKTYGTLFVVLVATVKGSEEIYQNSIIKAPNTRDPENPYEMMPVERKYKVRIHRFFKVPPLCGELVNSSIIVILTDLTQ